MPYAQGLPFAKGSHTSFKAADSLGRHRARGAKIAALMAGYRAAGKYGLTDAEAADMLTDQWGCTVPVQSICSLRGSLVEEGVVGKGGQRMGNFGHVVTCWIWIA